MTQYQIMDSPVIGNTRAFGYDAVSVGTRRQSNAHRTRAEDAVLDKQKRRRMTATARDIRRNYAVAAWAIRKHLDFVSTFNFQAKNEIAAISPEENERLNTDIEQLMRWWGNRNNCDLAGRHPLRRLIRLAEAHRTVDGDFFFYRLNTGRLQGIEGDHVANAASNLPNNVDIADFKHGIRVDKSTGRALRYMICDRTELGGQPTVYRAIVPARHIFPIGYFDRIDQFRGISPLASALNTFQDTYEGIDYALAKLKISQMFGLVFSRDASDSMGMVSGGEDADGDGEPDTPYNVDFGRGPVQLDLDAGDKADFLESKTPATETQAFLELTIQVALKALDIPYSFFNESFTNFYGSRGGLMQYLKSCDNKQADLIDMLDEITAWRLALFIQDGLLTLPAGITLADLRWAWVPAGVPWWDPSKEVKGHTSAIAAGLDNPQRICRESGTDYYENIDLIAKANEYAARKGVDISLDGASTDAAADTADAMADEAARNGETP